MKKNFEMNESAAIITVIAMQLVTVFASGNMDLMDFVISLICFLFALNCLFERHFSIFSKWVLAVNLALSSTYAIVIPFVFMYYWFANSLGLPALPLEFGTHRPLSDYTLHLDLPRCWSTKVDLEDAIAIVLIPIMAVIVFIQQACKSTQ